MTNVPHHIEAIQLICSAGYELTSMVKVNLQFSGLKLEQKHSFSRAGLSNKSSFYKYKLSHLYNLYLH